MKSIPKIFTRDFPALLCQISGRRYKSFFGIDVAVFPRCIFVFRQDLVDIYRNAPDLYIEINTIFKKKINNDPGFLKSFLQEYLEKAHALKDFMDTEPITAENLLKFSDDLTELWHGLYASLFIYPDETFDTISRGLVLEFRHKTEKLEYELFNYIEASLKHLYPSLGHMVKYIFWEELASGEIPNLKELEKRIGKVIIVDDKPVSADEFLKLQGKFAFILEADANVKGATEFNGQVAFRGKVQGKVRKVMKVSDIFLIQNDEVLVSYMTIPDFLPAMVKASAFITDEGGITCHAAIVAREMKKPCIIGTKIATQVLKDGDIVEVDANAGIVRLLK